MWTPPPPPGFCGLRDDLLLTDAHLTLPHWRQIGATYFVTFYLHDAVSQPKVRELEQLRQEWEQAYPEPRDKQAWDRLARETMRRVDPWLDQGVGSCLMKSPEPVQLVADALHRSHGSRCELGCYVIMPNHVHVVMRPLAPESDSLDMILKHWKASSARSLNETLKTSGTLWQRETFDHIVRDAEQLWRIFQYIAANPGRAGLPEGDGRLWISPTWIESGWRQPSLI
jgi:hypothetical protein